MYLEFLDGFFQYGLPKDQTTKWLLRYHLERKTSNLEHRHKYPQSFAGERAGGKVRKKLKKTPEAPDAPEPPVPPGH
jgi:hypothetical protein